MSDNTTTSAADEPLWFFDPAWADAIANADLIDLQADQAPDPLDATEWGQLLAASEEAAINAPIPDQPLDPCPFCGSDSCAWDCQQSRGRPAPKPRTIPEGVINECRILMAALDRSEWPEDDVYSVAPGYDLYVYIEKGQQGAFVRPSRSADPTLTLR